MTVYAITDTKKGRTGIAPTYLQTTRILLFIIAEIEVKDMPRVCLRTLPLTWRHGNEASTRNCEEVAFYFP